MLNFFDKSSVTTFLNVKIYASNDVQISDKGMGFLIGGVGRELSEPFKVELDEKNIYNRSIESLKHIMGGKADIKKLILFSLSRGQKFLTESNKRNKHIFV